MMFDVKLFTAKNPSAAAQGEQGGASSKINDKSAVYARDATKGGGKRHERKKEDDRSSPDEAGGHFASLKATADLVNEELRARRVFYRFYVFREFDDVFINLVRLGGDGSVVGVIKKNITHEEFTGLIKSIQEGEGFLLEMTG